MLEGAPRKLQFTFADADDASSLGGGSRDSWREGVDIPVLLSKIGQRRQMLAASAIAGAVLLGIAGAAWLVLRPTSWSASTEILVSNTSLALSGQDAVVTQLMVENTVLQSQMLLARSNTVLERALDRIGAARVPDLLPQPGLLSHLQASLSLRPLPTTESAEAKAAAARHALTNALKQSVSLSRDGASQIIRLRAVGSGPEAAVRLANELTQAFLAESRDISAVVTTSGVFRDRIRVLGPTVRLVSEASPPAGKDGPRALHVLLLGPLAGALLGLLAGLAVAVLTRRIWSAEELTKLTGAEFFGYIPEAGVAPPPPRAALDPALPDFTAALKAVRAVGLERRRGPTRILGVTSLPDCAARTAVAKGLALLFAGDDHRVLLIDAAIGSQALSASLSLRAQPGLQDVLNDVAVLPKAIQASRRDTLDVLGVGRDCGDIDSRWPQLRRAVDALARQPYDWIILDLPPLLPASTIRAAGPALDDLVLVVPQGVVNGAALADALRALGPVSTNKLRGCMISCREPERAPFAALVARLRPVLSRLRLNREAAR